MINIGHIIKRVIYLFTQKQSEDRSLIEHEKNYINDYTIENIKRLNAQHDAIDFLRYYRFTDMVTPSFSKMTIVDIGSGYGYFAGHFSRYFKKVIGIEPSKTAIVSARKVYPRSKFKNIVWQNGFGEDLLKKIDMSKPLFFFTGTVLSHLTDEAVIKICKEVSRASKGSKLLFCECFGPTHHAFMWHVRTQEWWQKQLPGWKIDFFGGPIENVIGRRKCFNAVKIK